MLISMTGFGRGEAVHQSENGATTTVTAELRSVNNRFIEISVRLPRSMNEREFEVREAIRKALERGKISASIGVERQGVDDIPISINESAAKAYFHILDRLRTLTGVTAEIQLRDLTSFGDIFQGSDDKNAVASLEWDLAQKALTQALEALKGMRKQEGGELEKDLRARLAIMDERLALIEEMAKKSASEEYAKVKERVIELTQDMNVLNDQRLELEVALLAERLDVTEEIVRFRSHVKFFLEAVEAPEPAGRKLNFILQEMNREVNTIGSKTNQADVAHHVVMVKQELEKMREQVQNIE
jgi:uncharacterized protein (TIGR00255 family)